MGIDEAILIMENERPHCGDKLTFTEGERCEAYTLAIDALKALASAQPEPCEDTVSRQRLLSDLKELVAAWKKYPVMAKQIKGVEAAIEYVEAIPSAQPGTARRIVGKSRDGITLWYQCDMCNEPVDAQDNFCSGCGRRLTDG